jgi:activator of HSP90 ATPase
MDKFKITVKLSCKAKDVFTGWLNNETHAIFTGGAKAEMSPSEGGKFSAYGGYITGTNVEIFPHKRIIQKWRTTEFAKDDADSILELQFTQKEDFTLVALTHSNLPDGEGEKYKKGWKERYFVFMKKHFGGD